MGAEIDMDVVSALSGHGGGQKALKKASQEGC